MKLLFTLLILTYLLSACQRDKYSEAYALYQNGVHWEKSNYPDSAANAYREAIDLLNNSREYELMCRVYNQFGDLLSDNKVYDKALDAYGKALIYGKLLPDKTHESRAYRGIGKKYLLQKNNREALAYFLKALALENKIEDKEECSSIYNNLSNAYSVMGLYKEALEYNIKAIGYTKDSLKIYRNYAVKGRIYTMLKQYDSAYHYLFLGSHSSYIRTQTSCLFKLAEMPPESGITASMKYNFLNRAQLLDDSIQNMYKSLQIAEADHQHQLKQQKNKDKSKFIYVVLFSLIFILSVFTYLYYRYVKRIKQHQEKMNLLYAEFEGQKEERISDNDNREKQIISIVSNTGVACAKSFASSPFYAKLKDKLKLTDCILTYTEQDELQKNISSEFGIYIQQISNIINLSPNDALLCCLSLLRFTTRECAVCRGVSNETIRSQRTRIKKKIPKTFLNNGLFDVIFGDE